MFYKNVWPETQISPIVINEPLRSIHDVLFLYLLQRVVSLIVLTDDQSSLFLGELSVNINSSMGFF